LPLEKKKNLLAELKKLNHQKLSEFLDVIEIVLGFLASAGGAPSTTFHQYVAKTLAMQRTLPKVIIFRNAITDFKFVTEFNKTRLPQMHHISQL